MGLDRGLCPDQYRHYYHNSDAAGIRPCDLFGNASPLSNLASVGLAGTGNNVPDQEETHLVLDVRPNPARAGGIICDIHGRHLSPGVYFCRLEAGEATITRKFIVLR